MATDPLLFLLLLFDWAIVNQNCSRQSSLLDKEIEKEGKKERKEGGDTRSSFALFFLFLSLSLGDEEGGEEEVFALALLSFFLSFVSFFTVQAKVLFCACTSSSAVLLCSAAPPALSALCRPEPP